MIRIAETTTDQTDYAKMKKYIYRINFQCLANSIEEADACFAKDVQLFYEKNKPGHLSPRISVEVSSPPMHPEIKEPSRNMPGEVAPPLTEAPQPVPTDSHAQGTRYFCGICGGTSEPCTHQRELAHAQGTMPAKMFGENLSREELLALLNTPEIESFDAAVPLEASHQVARWGAAHDAGKNPEDWFWLIGYLAGKALAAYKAGDLEKAKHHCISTAAATRNWHAAIRSGESNMRPGISAEKQAIAQPSAPSVSPQPEFEMSDELLPCPFCGCKAEMRDNGDGADYIECLKCGASTNLQYSLKDDGRPQLRERWNRRVALVSETPQKEKD